MQDKSVSSVKQSDQPAQSMPQMAAMPEMSAAPQVDAMNSMAMPAVHDMAMHDMGMTAHTMSAGHDMSTMPGGHSGHGAHSAAPAVAPPGVGASQTQIADFLAALAQQPDMHMHAMGGTMAQEHMAVMGLVPRGDATHVAIGDGNWSDPAIWSNGEVPGAGARVLIPEGVDVTYTSVSDASLFTLRIDGTLDFATNSSSQMVFDTMVVGMTGDLVIGTAANPVQDGVSVDLIVANNGAIDTGWDGMLMSRGIVSMGAVSIHGARKDSHEKVTVDPMAGSMTLEFAGLPEGWQVGDTLVVAGSRYDGYKWDNDIRATRLYDSEDEVRTITAISADGTVTLNAPLAYNHDTPRADLKISVANYTRNVSVETENWEQAQVWERGHTMFMHSDDVDVQNAAFTGLGRTDKSFDSMAASSFGQVSFDSNVQGRYPLHLHMTGVDDLANPAILEGTAVFGSPGWGIVHHDSNAIIRNSATFDTFGAGIVSETGNETGLWEDNIAILATGLRWDDPKNLTNLQTFDTGRSGDGFWFQGRMVASVDNIAASVNNGFTYFHRDGDGRMIPFDASLFDFPDALYNDPNLTAHATPILGFEGNEAFGARQGLHVVKANPNQGHDVWSILSDFTAWSVQTGAHLEYTSHYLLENFDLIGKEDTGFSPSQTGISIGNNTSELTIVDGRIDNFGTGIDFAKSFDGNVNGTPEDHDYVVIDTAITNTPQLYANYDPALDAVLVSGDLRASPPGLALSPITMGVGMYGGTAITGTKSDSLGITNFPGGTDVFQMSYAATVATLEQGGFWQTSGGQAYFLIDVYFTDRVTGEIFYETHPVFVPGGTAGQFGTGSGDFGAVAFNGVQDMAVQNGVMMAGARVLDAPIAAVPNGGFNFALGQSGGHDSGHSDGGHSGHDEPGGAMQSQSLIGGVGSDFLTGAGMNDRLEGRGGDDFLEGGGGVDTAVFSGGQSRYTLDISANGTRVTDRSGQDGTDTLSGIEFLDFSGAPFDLNAVGGIAGLSGDQLESFVEFYVAYFNRAPDAVGLAFWGTAFANGLSLEAIAAQFMQQPEAQAAYGGNMSNMDFVSAIYSNVLGRAPDAAGLQFWSAALDLGFFERHEMILEVLNGARAPISNGSSGQQALDQAYLENKTDLGTYYAVTLGMSNLSNATTLMQIFNGSENSLQAARGAADGFHASASAAEGGDFLMPIIGVLDNPFG